MSSSRRWSKLGQNTLNSVMFWFHDPCKVHGCLCLRLQRLCKSELDQIMQYIESYDLHTRGGACSTARPVITAILSSLKRLRVFSSSRHSAVQVNTSDWPTRGTTRTSPLQGLSFSGVLLLWIDSLIGNISPEVDTDE